MAGSDGSEEARSDSQQAMLEFMRSTVVAYATFRTRFGIREKEATRWLTASIEVG
jgi:hypothetical protein